jgi:hypothetical protein
LELVFADAQVQALCVDGARAASHWGAAWPAMAVCLSLLLHSADVADLRRWSALNIRLVGGRIEVAHLGAVVTLAPLGDNGAPLTLIEEDAVEHIRYAQVTEVVCADQRARARRTG